MTTFALLGSGEFEPWSAEVDRAVLGLADGDARVLILPTASSKEGDEVFDGWGRKGLEHFESMGVRAEIAPLKTREDAERDDIVSLLDGASVAYFSGGNPWYLAEVLRGTRFLQALIERMNTGLAYVGCSAGVACLTEMTFDSDTQDVEQVFKPGLALVRQVLFGPHWDIVDTWIPGATDFIVGSVPPGHVFVGIDENTAMVGDGSDWIVMGVSAVHVRRDGAWERHAAGDAFRLPLGPLGG